MGYFSEEDIKRTEEEPKISKNAPTKEQLIKKICFKDSKMKKENLEKLSYFQLKLLLEKLELIEKQRYFSKYGQKEKSRLYEINDEEEEEEELEDEAKFKRS